LRVADLGGAWVAQSVKHLPSAQVMILGSWDPAPSGESLLIGESASSSPSVPLMLTVSNKSIKYLNKRVADL